MLKKKKENDFEWCSLPLADSTDITDTAQLFTEEVNAKSEVTEELASMNSPCGTTTDRNFFKKAERTLTNSIQPELKSAKMSHK